MAGKERKEPPKIHVASGPMNDLNKRLKEAYEEANPGRTCRFVYAPEHKSHYTNLSKRRAQGYQLVTVEELGIAGDTLPIDQEGVVRVGDTVMMSHTIEGREALIAEDEQAAADEAGRVEREFYEHVEGISTQKPGGEIHKPTPRGRSVIREAERTFDYTQK